MLSKSQSGFTAAVYAVLFVLSLPGQRLDACGLNWSEPKSHFDGVSSQGYVLLVEHLGDIQLADGFQLPVRAIFRSESNSTSPILGHGWALPLLESHIVQVDERWFRVVEPTGWYRLFWRDEKDPTVLHGQGNWKGVIRGNNITVMADCGSRMDFQSGRLTSMHLKDRKLDIVRSPDGGVVLTDGMSPLLTFQQNSGIEDAEILLPLTSQKIQVGYTLRPLVEVVGKQPLISGQEKSLGMFKTTNGKQKEVKYGVDPKLNPRLDIHGREIAWDPVTKRIIKDREWTYDIKPSSGTFDHAAIGRKNSKNKSEFWHRNSAKGEEIVRSIDGVMQVTSWFTRGKLAGALRRREEIVKGVSNVIYQASYDEKGKLSREILKNGEVNYFAYAEDGSTKSKRRTKLGETKEIVEYKEGGTRIISSSDGRITEYYYDDQGREKKILINESLHSLTTYAPDNSWHQTTVYNQKSGTPVTTFHIRLNANARVTSEVIWDHAGVYPEIFKHYSYDHLGRLEKEISSQQGTISYSYSPDGNRTREIIR